MYGFFCHSLIFYRSFHIQAKYIRYFSKRKFFFSTKPFYLPMIINSGCRFIILRQKPVFKFFQHLSSPYKLTISVITAQLLAFSISQAFIASRRYQLNSRHQNSIHFNLIHNQSPFNY